MLHDIIKIIYILYNVLKPSCVLYWRAVSAEKEIKRTCAYKTRSLRIIYNIIGPVNYITESISICITLNLNFLPAKK